ncbi:MAG: VWA domain-containing protein [Kangiellaceae bacterium]|nr:VWA domain-containing protein [Kangiellaceae bacterium]MCW9016543.1 VWA domain-containing protein [Kangiellaceae bacterium]
MESQIKQPAKNMVSIAVSLLLTSASLSVNAQNQQLEQQQVRPAVVMPKPKIEPMPPVISPKPNTKPKIQIAILLDTSGSMDGLINQTRNQLWQVVNEFSTAKRNGVAPILEVALFDYGNTKNPQDKGYIRKLNNFTTELDRVSEGLFSLTTNGGDEYCGYAIKTAVEQLQWSQSPNDIKSIFIAGNEPFTQGPIHFQEAIAAAKKKGISVNTIYAGDYKEGVNGSWKSGALIADGSYMSIDANQRVVHVEAPQDKEIAELNAKLNQTYVPYGETGKESAMRQMEQDRRTNQISGALLAKRAKTKSSTYYNNKSWDLVDAIEEGEVSVGQIAEFQEQDLPEEMHDMSVEEKKDYVIQKAEERKAIQEKIIVLGSRRAAYVAEKRKEQAAAAPTMDQALSAAIKKQAEKKSFSLEAEVKQN